MNKVFIMRGPSGSGKDHWIRTYCVRNSLPDGKVKVFSTDSYFMIEQRYVFDATLLSAYHNRCLKEYTLFIQQAKDVTVFVNNTNTRVFEIAPYYRLAEVFGLEVQIVWVMASPELCKQRNVHMVPPYIIDKQFSQVEPLPDWWKFQVVLNQ